MENAENEEKVLNVYFPTDEEEAEIQAMIAADPDCPEITEVQASARVRLTENKYDQVVFVEGGEPPSPIDNSNRELVYIDKDLVDYFVSQGMYWENRMNAAFRRAVFAEGQADTETQVPATPDFHELSGKITVLITPGGRELDFIDKDLVEHFRQGGGSWEDRMNEVFRQAVLADEKCRKNNGP